MKVSEWWKEHRSNLFFYLLGSSGCGSVLGSIGHAIANEIHGHPIDWWVLSIFILFGVFLLAVGALLLTKSNVTQTAIQGAGQATMLGIPTVSALQGVEPEISFDPKVFFAAAYYSPVTEEIGHNIKIIARKYSPNDVESFYSKFIGVGYISTTHEYSWVLIFGSQLRALVELNAQGVIALDSLRTHYDKAASNNTAVFRDFSFKDWCAFLQTRSLLLIHPSNMVEITHYGRDFLKYLSHVGKDINARLN